MEEGTLKMHDFKYRKGALYCEKVNVEELAKEVGTPFYLYSYNTLIDHFIKLKKAFSGIKPLICFSVKCNSNLALLKMLVSKGAGLDVVSGGELYRAKKVGCPAERIVYASVGKTEKEIKEAMRYGILLFNVESVPELDTVNRVAGRLKKRPRIAIRINPNIESGTHAYITTGKKENKFGIGFREAGKVFKEAAKKYKNLDICGIHLHIGSQITKAAPYKQAIAKTVNFIKANKIKLDYFDIGGGLGIIYDKEKPQTAGSFARSIKPLLKKIRARIILEPGRFIAGNSGALITRVTYVKDGPTKKFIIVDAGMNDLIRPSLYSAYHTVAPCSKKKTFYKKKVDIVGPICESGDFLAKGRRFQKVAAGDYLAVLGAGAYGFVMSSNYNSRPRAAEMLVKADKYYLIRKKETYKDLVSKEVIPRGL